MGKEKRLYRRLIVDRPAQCSLSESSSGSASAKISDIGPEGIGFVVDEKLDIGTSVYLDIDLGNENRVELKAEVLTVESLGDLGQFRVGARIFDTQKEDLEKFVRFYCEQLMPVKREKKKILVIEDEKAMAALLRMKLTESGYDVVGAHDGEVGFSKYIVERPDLIILDIMLPKLSGFEICRKIRREHDDNNTPIIILTSKTEDADRIIGSVVGAQKYLTKPFDPVGLIKEVRGILGDE